MKKLKFGLKTLLLTVLFSALAVNSCNNFVESVNKRRELYSVRKYWKDAQDGKDDERDLETVDFLLKNKYYSRRDLGIGPQDIEDLYTRCYEEDIINFRENIEEYNLYLRNLNSALQSAGASITDLENKKVREHPEIEKCIIHLLGHDVQSRGGLMRKVGDNFIRPDFETVKINLNRYLARSGKDFSDFITPREYYDLQFVGYHAKARVHEIKSILIDTDFEPLVLEGTREQHISMMDHYDWRSQLSEDVYEDFYKTR